MLGLAIFSVFILAAGIYLYSRTLRPRRKGTRTTEDFSMLYAHGSRDVASEVYFPAIRDSTMLFPLSKREEREKTETYSRKK